MPHRPPLAAATLLGLVLVLSGCGSDGPPAEPSPSPETASASPAGDEALTSRGNIAQEVGEEAHLTAPSGGDALTFTVTDIDSDVQCTGASAEAPENRAFVKVDITASTGAAEDMEEVFHTDSMLFDPYDWKFVDSSGRTANDISTFATYSCLDDKELLPPDIGPGENVSGSLILDVTDTSGTLVYRPAYDSPGWEWSI